MTTITIKADSREMESIIKSVNKWMKDFRKPFKKLQKIQLKEIDEAFKVDWRNINWVRWKKLQPATTRQKIKLNVNKGILQRSWKLRKSFKKLLLRKDRLVIWNTKTYFKYHQRGTMKTPQRQSLGHGNIMIKRTEILVNQYLLNLIQAWMK